MKLTELIKYFFVQTDEKLECVPEEVLLKTISASERHDAINVIRVRFEGQDIKIQILSLESITHETWKDVLCQAIMMIPDTIDSPVEEEN